MGFVVSMNGDASATTANSSAKMLPRIATTALAVTPTGLLMRIIYFLIGADDSIKAALSCVSAQYATPNLFATCCGRSSSSSTATA